MGCARPDVRRLRGAGDEDRRVPTAHPVLRSGWRRSSTSRSTRSTSCSATTTLEEGVKTGKRLSGSFSYMAAQLLPAREAYADAFVPEPGAAAAVAPGGVRARRCVGRAGGTLHRRPASHHRADKVSGRLRASTGLTSCSTAWRLCRRNRSLIACGCLRGK